MKKLPTLSPAVLLISGLVIFFGTCVTDGYLHVSRGFDLSDCKAALAHEQSVADDRVEAACESCARYTCREGLKGNVAYELGNLFQTGKPSDEFDAVIMEALDCISAGEGE